MLDLGFSPCSNLLASVSKNRQLSLYFRWSYIENSSQKFKNFDISQKIDDFLAHNKSAIDPENLRKKEFYFIPLVTREIHSKLIFSVSVSESCQFVATGSRDKKVKVFKIFGEKGFDLQEIWSYKFKSAVRAVEFLKGQTRFLAIGLENGQILIADINGINIFFLIFRSENP